MNLYSAWWFLRAPRRLLLGALLLCASLVAGALGVQAVRQARARAAAPDLANLVPPGALLAIQSPDFARLLAQWNSSAEQKQWLGSASYSVFQNSRLFGRLSDAEGEFARASGVPAAKLLPQVAGTQSIFAWYDVGSLEFLYITRLAPGQAESSDLVRQRTLFSQRSAGGIPFFVRIANGTDNGAARTVAFATSGDLLLLATREDLMAGALERLAQQRPIQEQAGAPGAGESLAQESWFRDASAALPESPGQTPVLHMVLNLKRIVPMPYFRTYWIQQNVTQLSRFRASAADLYDESGEFREERVLLPVNEQSSAARIPPPKTGLASLAALAPPAGVFRATATDSADDAIDALQQKLLGHATSAVGSGSLAANPDLNVAPAGEDPESEGRGEAGASPGNADLTTRIDTPPLGSASASNRPLEEALHAAGFNALLTWSAAGPVDKTNPSLWVPLHSAVVLRGNAAWSASSIAAALQASLRGGLTTGGLGVEFRPATPSPTTPTPATPVVYVLDGSKPLLFTVRDTRAGHLLFLADSTVVLDELVRRADLPPTSARDGANAFAPGACRIAGFDLAFARAPYARLTTLIDGTNRNAASGIDRSFSDASDTPRGGTVPALFSQNLLSLADAFSALSSERFVEWPIETEAGPALRQTVLYKWSSQ
jgi:hypothetical protein